MTYEKNSWKLDGQEGTKVDHMQSNIFHNPENTGKRDLEKVKDDKIKHREYERDLSKYNENDTKTLKQKELTSIFD